MQATLFDANTLVFERKRMTLGWVVLLKKFEAYTTLEIMCITEFEAQFRLSSISATTLDRAKVDVRTFKFP
jgi:hypothetical protein